MKKIGICLLSMCMLLCGCTGKRYDPEALQQQYAQIGSAEMKAAITCHLAEENRRFEVSCRYERDGESEIRVTAPEELAGISAVVSGEELSVSYDGVSLPVGSMEGLLPANCLPWLLRAVAEGYVTDYGEEQLDDINCLRMTLSTTATQGEILCSAWFDGETLLPHYAEFSREGQVLLSLEMLSFTWKPE